jgi:hypothetical protein
LSSATSATRYSGIEGRRSTRVDHPVTLIILGKNGMGQPFQEKTSSVSVNLHGCRYPSRHEYPVGSWVGLQVIQSDGQPKSPLMRAQVRSIHTPDTPRELFQIGVELESPSNVWGVPAPPADWARLLGGEPSTTHLATGGNLPREPISTAPVNGSSHGVQPLSTSAAPNGSAAATAAAPEAPKQIAAPRTERFVITSDQLILSVRPKLQQAAEQAIQGAIGSHLDSAVRDALCKIDDLQRAGAREHEVSVQNFEPLIRSSEESVLNRLEARLTEVRSQWEQHQIEHRSRMDELSQRLEQMVGDARHEIAEAKASLTASAGEKSALPMDVTLLDSKLQSRMEESIRRASQEFESAATRVSDRHLVRLMEDKQMVAREASAQMEARAADARALLHGAASDAVGEFRRQLQAQIDIMISEATQKTGSALASLDAESRSACEVRRRSLESDVAKAAEQSAEQFRTGIKAFLYSCLVAAVSAVDEHSQSTLESLVKGGPEGKENGHNGKVAHQFTIPGDNPKDKEN